MITAQTRGRLTLIAIAVIFAVPIATAMYFYFASDGWRPGTNTEHGDLITPPRTLADSPLTDGEPLVVFREVWTMAVLAGKSCDTGCAEALVKIRQIRLSLGPKMTRMQTVYLPADLTAIAPDTATVHPKLIVVDPELSTDFRAIIGPYKSGQIFLIDPFGNLMMSYPADAEMGDIRKDLGHLFALSTIG